MESSIGTPRPGRSEQRVSQASAELIEVKLRLPGESKFTSRVADLSTTGFRLVSFVRLEPGAGFWVMFPGFEGRKARVLWSKDYEAGCVFERPLHAAVLDYILQMNPAGNGTV